MPRVYYSSEYVCASHSFETTRKAEWVADSLERSAIPGIEIVEPRPLRGRQVAEVHDEEYVRAVKRGSPRSLAESQGFAWDAGLWRMVLASNGGVVAAAFAALEDGVSGSLSSGLHHARYDHGAGFCTFNGLVIAAKAALDAGVRRVLILDCDAHCGGGTESLIADEPRISQLDVAVDSYDRYSPTTQARLTVVTRGSDYLPTIRQCLADENRRADAYDLCLYNAGMDPFEYCPTGGLSGITQEVLAERERMVFEWCSERRMPVAFVLAGGYIGQGLDVEGLVALHRLTLSAAASRRSSLRS
jgi:acetoin utilization deacetylase AcuC-like enzyme